MLKTQYLDLSPTYLEGFHINLGNKSPIVVVEQSSFTQNLMPPKFSLNLKKIFNPPQKNSNGFRTLDYDDRRD